MKRFLENYRLCASFSLSMFCLGAAAADQTAIAFHTSTAPSLAGGVAMYGWQFTTRADIQVSALGLYDNAAIFDGGFLGDGLLEAHAIGIWDLSSPTSPLVSGVLPAGTVGTLSDGFRYFNTTPVLLIAEHNYVIGALYANPLLSEQDFFTSGYNDPTFVLTPAPEIEFGGYQFGATNVFGMPGQLEPGPAAAFGPNFTYSIVPEPSSLTLLLIGAGVLMRFKRTRRNVGEDTSRALR